MDSSRAEEKRKLDEDEEDEEEDDYEDDGSGTVDADKRRRRMRMPSPAGKSRSSTAAGAGSSGCGPASCQAENCSANMAEEKRYHRRHKVCEYHAKATVTVVAGIQQRFCQQCSRFHELAEFDQAKRSCRRRLAGHNERRRKSSYDFPGEGSS